MLEFKSVKEAVKKLNELLDINGKKVFIKRTNSYVKELIGVVFKTLPSHYEEFLKYRGSADDEINEAFNAALKILYFDKSARYAVGFPRREREYGDIKSPCLVSIQILKRNSFFVICYFRSSHIDEFPHDLARVSYLVNQKIKNGKILMILGSFHKDVR